MTKKFTGYEINEKDIEATLRYLITEKGMKNATREDAISFLEEHQDLAHLMAHKIVEDEKSGKIKPVKLESDKEKQKIGSK